MKSTMPLHFVFTVCISYVAVAATSSINATNEQKIPIVVGGACAAQGQIPYQVQYVSNGVLCGGSIISKNYVLTAAHCVRETDAEDIELYVGNTQLNEGQVIYVEHIKVHPSADIALLELDSDIEFNDNVKEIPLQLDEVPENASVLISGWGGINDMGPVSECLKFNTLKALNSKTCNKMYGPGVLCLAHREHNGACQGDSGGPAVYNGRLVGVAAFVIGGCASSQPDGYTLVSRNFDWIQDNSL